MKRSNKKGVKNVVEQLRWLFLKVLEFKIFPSALLSLWEFFVFDFMLTWC